ncbi:MBL fold metallo-hydrolase [Desulfogranum japonicum]|uniref:MBL fold metallo-hydrolase n=1 Tax=Desulfogranum japonicum TaxID=231447 RepID=UPI000413EA0D|nr:MBL fold metallo-hydrolase [Desulfogranum japonicum]
MKTRTTVLIINALAVLLVQSVMAQTPKAELKKITDSVYAYTGVPAGTPGNVFSANSGIVIGNDAVLVVDTLTSAKEAENFAADIRKVTDKPIRYVVNTHYHLDHALGNSFFADMGARIIGHVKCRDAVISGGDKMLENPAAFGLPEDFWEGTRIVAPDTAFERGMILDLGGITVKLIHTGFASHSAGSVIVHISSQDVLFAGDILFTDFHPYIGEGDLPGWEKNLDFIHEMNVSHIIPGHGPLSSNTDIEDMKAYLPFFDKKAKEFCTLEKDVGKLTAAMLEVLPKRTGGDFIVTMNLKTRYLPDNGDGQSGKK